VSNLFRTLATKIENKILILKTRNSVHTRTTTDSAWYICEEQVAIPNNSDNSHSATSDSIVTMEKFNPQKLMRKF